MWVHRHAYIHHVPFNSKGIASMWITGKVLLRLTRIRSSFLGQCEEIRQVSCDLNAGSGAAVRGNPFDDRP